MNEKPKRRGKVPFAEKLAAIDKQISRYREKVSLLQSVREAMVTGHVAEANSMIEEANRS